MMSGSNNCGSRERLRNTGNNAFTGYLPDAVYCAYYRGLLEAVAKRHSDEIRMFGLYQPQVASGGHLASGDAAANLNKTNGCEAVPPPLGAERKQLPLPLCSESDIAEGGEPRGQITFRPHSDIVSWRSAPIPPPPSHPYPRVIFQRPQRRRQAPPHLHQTTKQERKKHAKRRRISSPIFTNATLAAYELPLESSTYDDGKVYDAGSLLPELLESIFRYLDVTSRGRAAQVCRAWRDVLNLKSVWRGTEARLRLSKPYRKLEETYKSLLRRGVRRVKIMSIKNSLSRLYCLVPMLTNVDFAGCYNINECVMKIVIQRELPNLTHLDIGLCKDVGDGTLGRIGTYCHNLRVLNLEGNVKITNAGLLLLAWGAKELKSLNLKSCRNISDHGINVMALNDDGSPVGSKLEFLGLQDCKITDKSLAYISRGMPNLKRVNLSTIKTITDVGLKALAKMPILEEINAQKCENVTDQGLAYLSDGCKKNSKLKFLDLSFCSSVTDTGLSHVAQGLKNLASLSISSCLVGDAGLLHLANGLVHLQTLALGQCNNITEGGLLKMAMKAKSLRKLDIYGCINISDKIDVYLPRRVKTIRTLC